MNEDNSAVAEGTMFPAGHPLLPGSSLATLQLPVAKAFGWTDGDGEIA